MKKLLMAAALALAPAAAQSEALPDADPAIWVVKDEDTTIYLFGTFHLLDGKREWFNDEVRTAFDGASELVLEAKMPENPADLQALIARYATDQSGRTLSQRLSTEQNAKFRNILGSIGADPSAFDQFDPWFAAMILASLAGQKLGIEAQHGPETVLAAAAGQRGMRIGELEGMEFQIRMFDGMTEEAQMHQLQQAIDGFEELGGILEPMLAAWSSGDTDGLVEILNRSMADSPELYRIMFTDRNATWADWIARRMEQPGTVFLAVGAGHLAGRDNVQEFLAARGITAQRVTQ